MQPIKYFTKTLPATLLYVLMMLGTSAFFASASEHNPLHESFTASYNDPSSVDAALAYATDAVKLGDYESAIPPLERILMFNPTLSEVRLEVGVLYYLLGSNDMARQHLRIVANDQRASGAQKERAGQYLTKL